MKYHRVVTIGDVAQDQVQWFLAAGIVPASRAEALEYVNRWNRLAAQDVIRQGYTSTRIFYYLGEEA